MSARMDTPVPQAAPLDSEAPVQRRRDALVFDPVLMTAVAAVMLLAGR